MFTKESLKKIFNYQIITTILVSVLVTAVVLALATFMVWRYRAPLFKYFATEYSKQTLAQKEVTLPKNDIEQILPETILTDVLVPEDSVERAVQRANPAVVAIVVSKEVPKYKTSYQQQADPFAQFFGGQSPFGNLQIPVQTPDGTEKKQIGSGSGFIVSSDGYIVTNRHVVADTTADYEVELTNGKKYTATVLARDAILDVAIMKITASGLSYLTLGDSDSLKLGQSVVAIGNALGQFQNTISVGVVSGLSRSITASGGGVSELLDHVIQTDAAINPGNSGGPLLNLSGEVVGVNTAIVQGSQNIGFALPINSIKTVIDSVRKTGKIIRPYIGVRYQAVTPQLKVANNLSVDYGVIVKGDSSKNLLAVVPGSPADKAGIVENDIILEINDVKIDSDNDFAQTIRRYKVGTSLSLTILSKGNWKKVTVVLEAAPQE